MIIPDGRIIPKVGGNASTLDTDGHPTASAEAWGQPIPCHILINRQQRYGVARGGTFTIAHYTLIIDAMDAPQLRDTRRIRLETPSGDPVGTHEYAILSTEPLRATRQLLITV